MYLVHHVSVETPTTVWMIPTGMNNPFSKYTPILPSDSRCAIVCRHVVIIKIKLIFDNKQQ